MDPHRTRAYSADLKWRMVYQRLMLGLTYQLIAKNMTVDVSTVWRAVEKSQAEGTVATKYCKGPQTLKVSKFCHNGDCSGEACCLSA